MKIPAKADSYSVEWYTSTQNPVNGSYTSNVFYGSSLSDTWQSDLGTYGYIEWDVVWNVNYSFTGFTSGYTYLYMPYGWFEIDLPSTFPLTNFTLDSIWLDHYNVVPSNFCEVDCINTRVSNTARNRCPVQTRFRWNWQTAITSSGGCAVEYFFKVRAYCSDVNAVSLSAIGSFNLLPTFGQYSNNPYLTDTGAWIATFSGFKMDLEQYQAMSIANGYLLDIKNALATSSPPDPAVSEAETKASEAEELQEEEELLQEELESFFDENALDDVFEDEIEPMFQDAGIGAGLLFWKDWVNHHFNKGYNDGEHFSSTLSIVFNIMARLWK